MEADQKANDKAPGRAAPADPPSRAGQTTSETGPDIGISANRSWSPLARALTTFLEAIGSEGSKTKRLKQGYSILKKEIGRSSPEAFEWLAKCLNGGGSPLERWTAVEIAIEQSLYKKGKKRTIIPSPVEPNVRTAVNVARSVSIAARSFKDETSKLTTRHQRSAEWFAGSNQEHPLLAADSDAFWLLPTEESADAECPVIGLDWDHLARFAQAGAKVSEELQTRLEFIRLQQSPRDAEPSTIRAASRALRVLEASIDFASKVRPESDVAEEVERDYRLRVMEAIGRRQNVWALVKARKKLFSVRFASPREVNYWAATAVASWVSTQSANKILRDLPSLQLIAMGRRATVVGSTHLANRVARAIEERADGGSLSLNDWDALTKDTSSSSEYDKWADNLRVRFDVSGSIDHVSVRDPILQTAALHSFVDSLPFDTDFAPRLRQSALVLEPQAGVPALAKAVRKLEKERFERTLKQLTGSAQQIARMGTNLESTLDQIGALIGKVPSEIVEATAEAQRGLMDLANRVRREAEGFVTFESPPSATSDAIPESKSPALISQIQSLDNLATRPSAERQRLRAGVLASLLSALSHDKTNVEALLSHSVSLPPEGWAVIWEAGLLASDARLFESTLEMINRLEWAKRMWLDVLETVSANTMVPVPLGDALGAYSREALLTRIDQLAHRLLTPDTAGLLGRAQVEAGQIIASVSASIQNVIDGLYRIQATIGGGEEDGFAAGD